MIPNTHFVIGMGRCRSDRPGYGRATSHHFGWHRAGPGRTRRAGRRGKSMGRWPRHRFLQRVSSCFAAWPVWCNVVKRVCCGCSSTASCGGVGSVSRRAPAPSLRSCWLAWSISAGTCGRFRILPHFRTSLPCSGRDSGPSTRGPTSLSRCY